MKKLIKEVANIFVEKTGQKDCKKYQQDFDHLDVLHGPKRPEELPKDVLLSLRSEIVHKDAPPAADQKSQNLLFHFLLMSAYLSSFWMYLKMAPISVPQRKRCSPVLREPLVGFCCGIFFFLVQNKRGEM